MLTLGGNMKKKNECSTCGSSCGCNHGNDNHEGSYMVTQNLDSILHAVQEIMPLVSENDDVESWIEHKISVAKAALSDVRDSLMYHKKADQGMGDMPHEGEVEIEVLEPRSAPGDEFGLSKFMGGCQNEDKYFVGSGSINEKRQLIANNTNKKIIVESMKKAGNLIRVKTKSGKEYEYMPHFGAELEVLRCEDYGIRIKK